MSVRSSRRALLPALCLGLLLPAATVQANITGAIWSGNGLGATGAWRLVPGAEGLKIAWDIQEVANGWQYHYTITNASGGWLADNRRPYTLVLGFAAGFTTADWEVSTDLSQYYRVRDVTTWQYQKNYGAPGSLFGGLFREPLRGELHISFTSAWAPGPQNVYAVDGLSYAPDGSLVYVWAWNEGAYIQAPTYASGVIPAPVPAPAAAILGGVGLGLLGWVRRVSA
jgi:hypothetical protein